MIPEIIPVKNYSGNGTTTKFDFDFYIENENQLVVYHTDKDGQQTELEFGKDYAINEVGQENGSYITFPIVGSSYDILQGESSYGVGDAEKISICLHLPISQETEYGTSDKLDQKSLEYSLDYLTRLIQILNRQMERSVKVPEGAGQTADDLIRVLEQAQIMASESKESALQIEEKLLKAKIWTEGSDEEIEAIGGVHSAKKWAELSKQLPDQEGNADKFLKTDGVETSWATVPPATTITTYHNVVSSNNKTVVFGGDYSSFTPIDISSYAGGTYYVYKVDTTDEETQEVSSSISITTTASDTALQLAVIKIASGTLSEVLTSLQYTTESPLQEVTVHTEASWNATNEVDDSELNLVSHTFVDVDYVNPKTVPANTNCSYSKDGVYEVSSSAIATITVTKNGVTQTFYGTSRKIKAGVHFKSSLAGKFYYYEGQ